MIEGREAAKGGRGARIRRRAGVTQVQLAELVGVSPLTVSRWERGERTPREANARTYQRVLEELGRL